MKATVDESGQLQIIAETPIESYALRQWIKESIHYGCEGEDCKSILCLETPDFNRDAEHTEK